MIHYQLRCKTAHEFDGWFADSASFDKQAKLGLRHRPNERVRLGRRGRRPGREHIQ